MIGAGFSCSILQKHAIYIIRNNDINCKIDVKDRTLLHWLCILEADYFTAYSISRILEMGGNTSKKDINGFTCIDYAKKNKSIMGNCSKSIIGKSRIRELLLINKNKL